ncbi:MAG: DUF1816 domain-containing protein [Chroococcales cyanobacterium]
MMLAISLFLIYLVFASLLIYAGRSQRVKEWWLKIVTQDPPCTYYFGPFCNPEEAQSNEFGYLEDLDGEGANGIRVAIEKCEEPKELTIVGEAGFEDGVESLREQVA